MFIGSVPQGARILIYQILKNLEPDTPVYVGCSGNFTIDRLAAQSGFDVYANDISLYSKIIADIILHRPGEYRVTDAKYGDVFSAWPDHPYKNLIQVMFVMKLAPFEALKNDYQNFMHDAYLEKHQEFYEETLKKLENSRALNFKIKDFFFGDFTQHIFNAPKNAVIFLFAPTYKGGYEKIYKRVDEVFEYDKPAYEIFDSADAGALYQDILSSKKAVIYSDRLFANIENYLHGKVHFPEGRRDIFMYNSVSTQNRILSMPVNTAEKTPQIIAFDYQFNQETEIAIAPCEGAVVDHFKHHFMSARVDYSSSGSGLAFLADGRAFGFASFNNFLGEREYLFMQTDFVVSNHTSRLSKLLLLLLKSEDVKRHLMRTYRYAYKGLSTAVFTEKPVSMKYRGAFNLKKREAGKLTYYAEFDHKNLGEIYRSWMNKNSGK